MLVIYRRGRCPPLFTFTSVSEYLTFAFTVNSSKSRLTITAIRIYFKVRDTATVVACVASVSVRLSARSMHFSLFWPRENWGGGKKVRGGGGERREGNFSRLPSLSPLLPSVLRSPQFLRNQKAKNAYNGRKALRKRLLRRLSPLF